MNRNNICGLTQWSAVGLFVVSLSRRSNIYVSIAVKLALRREHIREAFQEPSSSISITSNTIAHLVYVYVCCTCLFNKTNWQITA